MSDPVVLENPKDIAGSVKPDLSLLLPTAEIQEARVMSLGANKYGRYNWRMKRITASAYIAACRRHLMQWADGEDVDSESGMSHLAHARACLGILMDAYQLGNIIDDRCKTNSVTAQIKETK